MGARPPLVLGGAVVAFSKSTCEITRAENAPTDHIINREEDPGLLRMTLYGSIMRACLYLDERNSSVSAFLIGRWCDVAFAFLFCVGHTPVCNLCAQRYHMSAICRIVLEHLELPWKRSSTVSFVLIKLIILPSEKFPLWNFSMSYNGASITV